MFGQGDSSISKSGSEFPGYIHKTTPRFWEGYQRHPMKTILVLLMLLYAIALPALGALTDADLDKIRLIVKEEISKETKPLKVDIDKLKTDGAIRQTEISNLKQTVNTGFANVQKNFDRQNNIIACIGIPLAILAIGATVWSILAHRRSRKDQTLEKQIETLTQEIETLKQHRIVSP
ncbi:hypothetical protein F4X88_14255 [Candidatus Poribacteria bacterium]|nr:hypothetical protein [Candidatus Poribacteria bacterium]MXV85517.1 hypothetical protein [Candidatus Poribacteria bacterium]MYA57453.1 hypothetical protein [Candidatus Poribacteria bacterium]